MPSRAWLISAWCSLLLSLSAAAAAQPAPVQPRSERDHWRLGIGFALGVPTGDFGERIGTGPGALISVDRQVGDSMVSVGGEAGFLVYGSESWRSVVAGTDIPVDLTTDNNVGVLNARVRLQPPSGAWRPYAEGIIGVHGLWTETSVNVDCAGDYCSGPSTTDSEDLALAWGAGGGVTWSWGGLGLDLGARYTRGGEAQYLTKRPTTRPGEGKPLFDVNRSRTDMLLFYVGLTLGR